MLTSAKLSRNPSGGQPAWRSPAGWQTPSSLAAIHRGGCGFLSGLPKDVLIQVRPSALSCLSVGMLWGRSLRKYLTTPWYHFCEQWLCLDCMKVRLALSLYPAISACDTRPEAYCSNVLRLRKYFTEWLKHRWYIFSAFQRRGSSLQRFISCHF